MKKIKMAILVMAAVTMMVMMPSISADAAMANGEFVSIASGTSDSITVNGVTVQTLYRAYDGTNGSDSTYSCAAFVKRFYRLVFGVEAYNMWSTTSTPLADREYFYQTDDPQVGDIIRDNKSVHWAIVKEVNGNTITVIQQNAWDLSYTQAWVGATIEKGDSRFTYFRWAGNPGLGYTLNTDRSSDDSIIGGLQMLEEALIYRESDLENTIGAPVQVNGKTYYYTIDTLFEKTATMKLKVKRGKVKKATWTYNYEDDSNASLENSQEFYNDIIRMVKAEGYSNTNAKCKNMYNQTFTFKGGIGKYTVERNIKNGIPQIKISVKK